MYWDGFDGRSCFFEYFTVRQRFSGHKDCQSTQHKGFISKIWNLPSFVKEREPCLFSRSLNSRDVSTGNNGVAIVLNEAAAREFSLNNVTKAFSNRLLLRSGKKASLATSDNTDCESVDYIRDCTINLHVHQQVT